MEHIYEFSYRFRSVIRNQYHLHCTTVTVGYFYKRIENAKKNVKENVQYNLKSLNIIALTYVQILNVLKIRPHGRSVSID